MKRLLGFVLSALLVPAALVAEGFSLDLDSSASTSRKDVDDTTVYEELAPAFDFALGSSANFAGKGYVKFAYSSSDGTPAFSYSLQELRLKVVRQKPALGMKSFSYEIGRREFADPSSYILDSPADGLAFSFAYPWAELAFRSGYTGFTSVDDSTIEMSLADSRLEHSDNFASPRFLVQADLAFPSFFGQGLTFSFLSQDDLTSSSELLKKGDTSPDVEKGGRVDTQYFELMAEGTIASTVSYGAFFVYGTGRTLAWLDTSYDWSTISSYFAGFRASAPLPLPIDGSTLGLRFLFASGDKDASSGFEGAVASTFHRFTPVTQATLAQAFSPALSNLVVGELDYSASPRLGALRFDGQASLLGFFRPTAGPITGVSGIDPDSSSAYLGSEADLSLGYRILSDVGLSLSAGVFVPGSAFAVSDLRYSLTAQVGLSL
jgi:hypothetical protein